MSSERWSQPIAQVRLDFDDVSSGEELQHDVSAIARIGDTLFLACDETATIEVLHRTEERSFGEHATIHLTDLFDLPEPNKELDIEGLAVDAGRLWIVGSHSCTREKPKKGEPVDEAALERLATVRSNPNRHFLACVSLVPLGDSRWAIRGKAQMLPVKNGSNALSKALKKDPHIKPFIGVPAKENGFDIEGIVVDGRCIAVGLRGPVVNGWGCVVTFEAEPRRRKVAVAKPFDYRKHWLDMDGLGVRDLSHDGADLLILAGPTQDLDGPVRLYRWPNWRSVIEHAEPGLVKPELLLELPHGEGCDHAEGMVPWAIEQGRAILVVHDSPCKARLDEKADVIRGDLFAF